MYLKVGKEMSTSTSTSTSNQEGQPSHRHRHKAGNMRQECIESRCMAVCLETGQVLVCA
jgi:hypothetical protein